MKTHFDSILKIQSNDRPFIADAGLKGSGFLFRFLNISKMLGILFFFAFTGVEGVSAFFAFSLSVLFHFPSASPKCSLELVVVAHAASQAPLLDNLNASCILSVVVYNFYVSEYDVKYQNYHCKSHRFWMYYISAWNRYYNRSITVYGDFRFFLKSNLVNIVQVQFSAQT